jgi:hypothetical protein
MHIQTLIATEAADVAECRQLYVRMTENVNNV